MEQPMWFHCYRELHHEAATRNLSTQNVWYNLGMVDEPHRTFMNSFATHFEIRSLHHFFRESDMWPPKADFVDIYYNDEELNTSNMAEKKLLSRLYDESLGSYSVSTLHSVASLGLHQTQVADSFMWEYKARKANIISHIFRALNSHESSGNLPNQPRVIRCQHIGHHGRDRMHWIQNELKTFMATSRHLRKRVLLIFEDLQFRLAFRMLPVRSRFWFLKDSHPDIILCTQPSCGAVESDQHHFLECDHTAQLWREILPTWDHLFSSRPRWTHIASAIVPPLRLDWKEYQQIVSDLWLALQAVTLHFVWTDRNPRLFDQRSATPTVPALSVIYTTFSAHVRYFRRQCYDQDEHIRLAKVLDQLATQGSFGGFFRSRRSLLRVRHRQVELQV